MRTDTYGAKADNLQILISSGFNVPAFYTLSSSELNTASDKDLLQTYKIWAKEHNVKTVAVRSSAASEDGSSQSFAGQFLTKLDVDESGVVAAIKEVHASSQHSAYSDTSSEVNVIIQQFIEPDFAGVSFSVDPVSGSQNIIINSAAGRGVAVVDGEESDHYSIDRFTQEYISGKPLETHKRVLGEVVDKTLLIEQLLDAPVDVEWASKQGELFLLQARPITKISHLRAWDSSNIAESFPGIVSPLTFSIARRGYRLGYTSQAIAAGLSWREVERNSHIFGSMIGTFNGRLYYNMLSWYSFINLFPGGERNQQFLDDQISTQGSSVRQNKKHFSSAFKLKFYSKILYRTLFFQRELDKFYKIYSKFEIDYARLNPQQSTMTLMSKYAHIEQMIIPDFGRTVDNDFFVMTFNGMLVSMLRKHYPQQYKSQDSFGIVDDLVSTEQALLLYEIAGDIQKDKKALKYAGAGDFEGLMSYLSDNSTAHLIKRYRQEYAHRFARDQVIESKNPVLDESGLLVLIMSYTKLDITKIRSRIQKSRKAHDLKAKKLKQQLRLDHRIVFTFLLNRLQKHLRIREKNRLLRGKIYGRLRELFPLIGQQMVTDGVIDSPRDIFYLTIEEILNLTQGAHVDFDLAGRVKARKKAYREFDKVTMPERFTTSDVPSLEKIAEVNSSDTVDTKISSSLKGQISSPGNVGGVAVVMQEPVIPKEPFDILVVSHTDPGWTPLLALAKGVVVEHGGMLSHAAIVTRELGIPSIIGVADATKLVSSGMHVRINTNSSCLELHSDKKT